MTYQRVAPVHAKSICNYDIDYDQEPQQQSVPRSTATTTSATTATPIAPKTSGSDPVLEAMDQSFKSMGPEALLNYFLRRFEYQFGYNYKLAKPDAGKERSIFNGFIERYGSEKAGEMVAIVFDKYKGELNGEPAAVTHFASGFKWIQDRLYHDVMVRGNRSGDFVPIPDATEFFQSLGVKV